MEKGKHKRLRNKKGKSVRLQKLASETGWLFHYPIVQSNHWSHVMWRASRHRGTLVFAPVIEGNWKDQECRKGLGCLSPPPYPPLILPDCFAPFVNSLSFYRIIGIKDKMKRLFFLNAATHVENGKKNLIARKSPQQVFLVNATSKLSIDIEPITASLSSAEAPARYPYKNSNNGKIERARGTMGRGKRREGLSSFFPLPIVPRALSFFSPQPPHNTRRTLRRRQLLLL